jgi:undecaprenyl-diphosphatase
MNQLKSSIWFERMDAWELTLCLALNRGSQRAAIRWLFAAVSRLGNGVFWYSLMAALVILDGRDGLIAAVHMGVVGALGVLIYKALKQRMVRQRPYLASPQIYLGAAPLDLYSFPSGHTLHAVSFTLIALSYYPALVWVLVPFSVLVALSRVVLGLHYPTDVLVGLLIGAALGIGSLELAALY